MTLYFLKLAFLVYKSIDLRKSHFSKGLVHGFGKKLEFLFFFSFLAKYKGKNRCLLTL